MMSWRKIRSTARWLPSYAWQRFTRRPVSGRPLHLIIALADHFEPAIVPEDPKTYASFEEQERRLERWCRVYPLLVDPWRDSDGRPFCHTYFYPAEQYNKRLLDRLVDHCRSGWGRLKSIYITVSTRQTPPSTRGVC